MSDQSRQDQGIMRRFIGGAIRSRIEDARRARRRARLEKGPDRRPHAALIFCNAEDGIGAAVAARAAAGGMKTYVAGADGDGFEAIVDTICRAGNEAQAVTVDMSQPEAIRAAFDVVREKDQRVELVVHHGLDHHPGGFLDISPQSLEESWVLGCRSAFLAGQQAITSMLEQPDLGQGRGTFLLTGAPAALSAQAGQACLGQAGAGLRMLGQALAREYGPQGIHVAHIIIDGANEFAHRRRAAGECRDEKNQPDALQADAIADTYWSIYQQHRSAWTQEIDLRPWPETG